MEHRDPIQQELTENKRHQAIHDYLFELVKSEPDLYFAPTKEVSRRIHDLIKERAHDMNIEQQKLVKGLSVDDIDAVLSFHSRR